MLRSKQEELSRTAQEQVDGGTLSELLPESSGEGNKATEGKQIAEVGMDDRFGSSMASQERLEEARI